MAERFGFAAAVSLTRTADTNAYGAGDVIGAATGSSAAIEFLQAGPDQGIVRITGVELLIEAAAVIASETSYRLHLYSITPPSALGDNAPWDLPAGDRASYLGYVDLGIPVDVGASLFVQSDGIAKDIKLASTSVFGYLVTVGGYTPTSARVYRLKLHTAAL